MTTRRKQFVLALVAVMTAPAVRAEGHGPAFSLATPTLARGQWSSDTGVMRRSSDAAAGTRFRQMLSHGVTEDLQLNLAFPLGQSGTDRAFPGPRGGSMMGSAETVEASLQWRFHRTAPGIGTRRESALVLGVSEPTDRLPGNLKPGTAVHAAAVTGYASRSVYWWLGGGAQIHDSRDGARLGDFYYATAVFGWRPPLFRQDYPKPDWRVFVEGVYERTGRRQMSGIPAPDSGGEAMLLGPSVLGLYGHWGVEAGVLWPVSQSPNGAQPEERYRAKLVLTYWF